MSAPEDSYVLSNVKMVLDGQHVIAQVRKSWIPAKGKFVEEVLTFKPDSTYIEEG